MGIILPVNPSVLYSPPFLCSPLHSPRTFMTSFKPMNLGRFAVSALMFLIAAALMAPPVYSQVVERAVEPTGSAPGQVPESASLDNTSLLDTPPSPPEIELGYSHESLNKGNAAWNSIY